MNYLSWGFVVALALIGCGDGSDGAAQDPAPATAAEDPPAPMVVGDCRDGMSLQSGEGCRYTGGGEFEPDVVLWVHPDGSICRVGGPVRHVGVTVDTLQLCSSGFERDDAFESEVVARENADGTWTFHESASSASADRSSASDPDSSGLPSAQSADGTCRPGLVVGRGESCVYSGTSQEFSVDSSGRGSFLFFNAGTGISARDTTVNGVLYDFVASAQGDGTWLIETAGDSD